MAMFAVGGQKMLYQCFDRPLYIMSDKVSKMLTLAMHKMFTLDMYL